MEDRIKLSYFYGREADQYSFYKIPKSVFAHTNYCKYCRPFRFCRNITHFPFNLIGLLTIRKLCGTCFALIRN